MRRLLLLGAGLFVALLMPACVIGRTGTLPYTKGPMTDSDATNGALTVLDQCIGSILGPAPACLTPQFNCGWAHPSDSCAFTGNVTVTGTLTALNLGNLIADPSPVSIDTTVTETTLHSETLPGGVPAVGRVVLVHAGGQAGTTSGKTMKWGFRVGGNTLTQVTMSSIDSVVKYDVSLTCIVQSGPTTRCTGTFVNGTNTTPIATPIITSAVGAWPSAQIGSTAQPNNSSSDDFMQETVFTVEVK